MTVIRQRVLLKPPILIRFARDHCRYLLLASEYLAYLQIVGTPHSWLYRQMFTTLPVSVTCVLELEELGYRLTRWISVHRSVFIFQFLWRAVGYCPAADAELLLALSVTI